MRILILNWKDLKHPAVGGAEIIAFELARRLVQRGHAVTWFAPRFPGGLSEETVEGIQVIRRGGALSTYFQAFRYYRSLAEKPDLVIDMVNTICWQTPLYVRGKRLAYVNQLAREVWFYQLPPLVSHLGYALERLQYNFYRRTPFLCYSASTKGDLAQFGVPESLISQFELGLDHTRYLPGEKASHPLFIYVGRLARMKRVDLCIRALALVLRSCPEAQLAIVGHGPERGHLVNLVHRLGLDRQVRFADKDVLFFQKTAQDQKVLLMQRAWALLLPSVKEGWGMVVTEANACGTPAIISNVTGLRDSVRPGQTGLVLSPRPSPQASDAFSWVFPPMKMRLTLFSSFKEMRLGRGTMAARLRQRRLRGRPSPPTAQGHNPKTTRSNVVCCSSFNSRRSVPVHLLPCQRRCRSVIILFLRLLHLESSGARHTSGLFLCTYEKLHPITDILSPRSRRR